MAAGLTKATTATTTAYTLTDGAGNTLTVTVHTPNAGAGIVGTGFVSSGNLQQDGMVLLATLTQQLVADIQP